MRIPVYELHLSGPHEFVRGVLQLARLIRREKFDIVHTHLYYANVAGRLAAWRRARVVSTLHNPDYSYEDPGTMLFTAKKLLDATTGRFLNDALLAVSEEVRRDYQRHLGFSDVRVIPNYIDVQEHQKSLAIVDRKTLRKCLGFGERDLVVLHVGRLHPQKGQDVLIEAVSRIRRRVPGLRLVLVGQGGLRGRLEGQALRAGLADTVRFVGAVGTVTPYYALADIFVFPSRYEAFGIALLEAMAAGLPIIASRTGGICELTTYDSALLVPVGDSDALAEAIVCLAIDPAKRALMGTAARKRASAYDVSTHLVDLEALYAAL
jgi:glycosyltransferase involved in cell wall biosynthesis